MMAQQLARSIAWSIVVLMCCAVGRVAGQTGSIDAATAAPLRYRRVYVPKEKLKEFTRGHMPLKREEFPKLVDRIDAHAEATHSDMAWIQSADYSAIFSNGQLESGLAQVHVMHTGVGATVLPLSPCALAMGPATWQGAESIRGAVVGSDLKGNLGVEVRESGELQFPWTLRGETNEWGETTFDVHLPPSPMNRLILDLPDEYELLADRGIISHFDDRQKPQEPSPYAGARLQRWIVQLGGATTSS